MIQFDIDKADYFYIGEDKTIVITVYQSDGKTPQDITSFTLSWLLKTSISVGDASALLSKTTSAGITISGTYSVDPNVNTQIATITIADTDTDPLEPGTFYHELKRTDAGSETVLCGGKFVLQRSGHHA